MGIIRGAILTTLSLILLLSFFLMAISLTLSWSLEFDTVQPALKDSVNELAEEQFNLDENIEGKMVLMQAYCANNTEFVLHEGEYTLVLPCDVVNKGSNEVINFGINSIIEQIYYTNYDCGFWNCLKETKTSFVLFSEKARSYWNSKFYIFLLTSIGLSTLIFFLSQRKHSAFLITGALLVISVLPLIKINLLLSSSIIPASLVEVIKSFFTKSYNVFLILLMVGILIFLFGISLHFFGLGNRMSKWFSKNKENVSKEDVKEIVKQEIQSKENPKKNLKNPKE